VSFRVFRGQILVLLFAKFVAFCEDFHAAILASCQEAAVSPGTSVAAGEGGSPPSLGD
jgi:hypothetical protein